MKLLLIGILSLMGASTAMACSCAQMEAEDLLKSSDMLFVGYPSSDTVLTGERADDFSTLKENVTEFGVTKGFVNTTAKKVKLYSHNGVAASCGIELKAYDGVYLVSAYKDPETGKTQTSSCDLGYVGNEETYNTIIKLEKLTSSK